MTLIRSIDHLAGLCNSVLCWSNDLRPQQSLARNRPNDVYQTGRVVPFAPTDPTKWGIWLVHIFVVIDHFSSKLIAAVPFKSPNAKPVVSALQTAIQSLGRPAHLVTDQGSVFTSTHFEEFLIKQDIDHVLGAVGQHGSIAKSERVISTLKREWLRRVPLIRGMDHLAELCKSAVCWYNDFRRHQGLAGNRPSDVYQRGHVIPSAPTDHTRIKSVPLDIERSCFKEPRTTAWRLKRCA